jgi:hypothetical protein
MRKKNQAICYFCTKKVEYSDCAHSEPPPEDARCTRLVGWLTLSHWEGTHDVTHLDFCSLSCLQKWVNMQIPTVPDVFLKALGED